ncbi:MAG: hypothetical protein AAFX50_16010, partial [Acidobacteriota bacterium]
MKTLQPPRGAAARTVDTDDAAGRNSCLLTLVIYATLSVVYALALQTRIDTSAAVPLALVLAIFGTLFLASAISMVVWPGEVRWLRAARRNEWPDDGEVCAVFGRISGEPKTAPISGEPAIAWASEAFKRQHNPGQTTLRKVLKVKCLGRVPAALDGPTGRVRLAGLLSLDHVKARRWKAEEVMAEAYDMRDRGEVEPFEESFAGPGAALDAFATADDDYEKVRHRPT